MPYSATRPRRAKAVAKRAVSAAKRTWQNSACTNPTPAHAPLIAAMSGFGERAGHVDRPVREGGTFGREVAEAGHVRAGAERGARSGDDDGAHRRVGRRVGERGVVRVLEFARPPVAALGPVEGERADARGVGLDEHGPVGSTSVM
jgi:hypothetical protein